MSDSVTFLEVFAIGNGEVHQTTMGATVDSTEKHNWPLNNTTEKQGGSKDS